MRIINCEYRNFMIKRILFSFLFLFTLLYNVKSVEAFYPEPTFFSSNDENYFLHTIERGETVFSISKMYHVSVEEINQLNPGSEIGIKAGETLKIPQKSGSYIYHTIAPKENLYSLSKRYFMKENDIIAANPGLSVETFTIDRVIRIPTNLVTEPIEGTNEFSQQVTNSLLSKREPIEKISHLNVALLLPFGLKEGSSSENLHRQKRFVEYYEGFLLSLLDLKQKGISVNLKVHDIGSKTADLMNLIRNNKLETADLLIGGLTDDQVRIISQYSKEYKIPYVIPVTSTSDAILDNDKAFQINTPHSYLFSKASLAFINRYAGDRIILLKDASISSDKTDFIRLLEQDLKRNNIAYHVLEYNETFVGGKLLAYLDETKNNVLVPCNDSAETLSKLITSLKIQTDIGLDTHVSLFGYPRWQSFSADLSDDFFHLKTTFFTFYYANPMSSDLKSFYQRFRSWYSHDLLSSYPKFGLLGYDTATYFIELLHTYGRNFEPYVNEVPINGIQTNFEFERINNWGGFINANLYFVEFEPSYTISKTIIR